MLPDQSIKVPRQRIAMVTDTLARYGHLFVIAVHNGQVLHVHQVEVSVDGKGRFARLFFFLVHPLKVEHAFLKLQILDRKLGVN